MKKLLISGGTGTIGSAFVRHYKNMYDITVLGHSEKRLREFKTEFPDIPGMLCTIEDRASVFSAYDLVRPDVVVHAAAIKHIDFADRQPAIAASVNVTGSLNVLAASQCFHTPITVAVSTDKASSPKSAYGYTKLLMEKCFQEADGFSTRFGVCRFGNVMGSAGSVIPIWRKQAAEGKPITITDERMKRFMFSVTEAVGLIQKAIDMCEAGDGGFVLTKLMKVVSILELAKCISPNVQVTGIRPGEQLDECLFNHDEAQRASIIGDFVRIGKGIVSPLQRGCYTETGEHMTVGELQQLVEAA